MRPRPHCPDPGERCKSFPRIASGCGRCRPDYNKKLVYDILFRATAETLLTIARDPKRLGVELGFFAVLHSWGQNLHLNPHS
jgi:hypothetical protein